MIPARWQQISEKLYEAMQLDTEQRVRLLEQVGSSDPEMRQEMETLLSAYDAAESSFRHAAEYDKHQVESLEPHPVIGQRFGAYRIIEQIGEGGMGEVYRAVRDDDQYQKQVAIKLVRVVQDSGFVVRRFKNERQILADLDHPNISRLLDGGMTDGGAPFLVMEYIEGETIDRYCNAHSLSIAQRLELFLQVCSAVQFAHQRLIIHRDIKPGNILVTSGGVPKLLDFGIAKILDKESSSSRLDPTVTMFRALTPAYASPEQVKGEPITTASDVYSLGVVLYELLAGQHPFRKDDSTPEQMVRALCETEPQKPSTAARKRKRQAQNDSSNSAEPLGFNTARKRLSRHLRGDLDNIVLMALRKEPLRRYQSVEQFAEDIRRNLGNLPVVARKDTARYRASKFVLRHKVGVAATAVALLALLIAFVVSFHEAAIAERRFNDVRTLANSLIFDVHDSIKDLPGATPARKVIAARALQYLNKLASESSGDIGLQRELATAYERLGVVQGQSLQDNLGDTKGGLESYKRALELRKRVDAKSSDWNDHLALARSYRLIADMQAVVGVNESRSNVDRAMAISEGLNKEHPNSFPILHELASEYDMSTDIGYPGDPNEHARWIEGSNKTLATYEAALKIQPNDLDILHEYAIKLRRMGSALESTKPKAALDYYQRVMEIERNLTQRSSAVKYARGLALAYRDVAAVYEYLGETSKSIEAETKSLEILQGISRADPQNVSIRRSLAIEHVNVALAMANTGHLQNAFEKWQTGAGIIRAIAVEDPDNRLSRHYRGTIEAVGGTILMREHNPEAALKQFEKARSLYESLREVGGASPFELASAGHCSEKIGEAESLMGNTRAAANDFRRALAMVEPLVARKPPDINGLYAAADAYSELGDLSLRQSQDSTTSASTRRASLSEARSWYSKSLDTWHQIEHPNRSAPANSLDAGDPAQVAKKLRRCERTLAQMHSPLTSAQ